MEKNYRKLPRTAEEAQLWDEQRNKEESISFEDGFGGTIEEVFDYKDDSEMAQEAYGDFIARLFNEW